MKTLVLGIGLLGVAALATAPATADPLKIVMTVHGATSNEFWQPIKKGFDDACAKKAAAELTRD